MSEPVTVAAESAGSLFAAPDIEVIERPDGVRLLSSRTPLGEYASSVGEWLQKWASAAPDRTFVAERDGEAWTPLSYSDAWSTARSIGQALFDRGLGPDRPLVVLSGPSIAHAQLMLAAHLVGVPFVPVSVAYSLVVQDPTRVLHIVNQSDAGLVFVEQSAPFARVLDALSDREIASGDGDVGVALQDLIETSVTAAVDQAFSNIEPDHVAKILYTSGSTGMPKGVLTTHRMLCVNQKSMALVWPFLAETPPIICDWLPWSHTFGSSHNFNLVLANGGTLYIDGGKPAPGLFDTTVANLADVRPTISFNVPAGFARLVDQLESDSDLADAFFSRLQLIFYAAAPLPEDVWRRLQAVSIRTTGRVVPMTSSWGLTETAPGVTSAHFPLDRPGVIGTPLPGLTLKLVPSNDKTEIRVAGPSVTAGYLNDAERSAASFDDEGFLITGDAVRLADPLDPNAGLLFDGRVGEDFKLTTGTWVNVGVLRPQLVSATAPLVLDCVVTGHGGEQLGLLVWLAPGHEDNAETRTLLQSLLAEHNEANGNTSSTRVRRVVVLDSPPSIDAGETTDKGYVNQGRALLERSQEVERLLADHPDDGVLIIG